MSYEIVEVSVDGHVGQLTINRPKALNALNAQTLEELDRGFAELVGKGVRAIILTGAGRAFVAGADIAQMMDFDNDQAQAFGERGQAVFAGIEALPVPVIAAVNGFALGGGCELAMACDFIVASEEALFGQPEVKLGIIPGFGGTQRLSRLVGTQRARDLIFTGRNVKADEALQMGLVSAVVPADELLARANKLAKMIAKNGPLAIAAAKRAILEGFDHGLAKGNEIEAASFGSLFDSIDSKEGMSAFLEKRRADFKGE